MCAGRAQDVWLDVEALLSTGSSSSGGGGSSSGGGGGGGGRDASSAAHDGCVVCDDGGASKVEADGVEEEKEEREEEASHVVIILPHAHVMPDEAVGMLRFLSAAAPAPAADAASANAANAKPASADTSADATTASASASTATADDTSSAPDAAAVAAAAATAAAAAAARRPVTISVVQLPCCGYVWHDTVLGEPADFSGLDGRICTAARTVRALPLSGLALARGPHPRARAVTASDPQSRPSAGDEPLKSHACTRAISSPPYTPMRLQCPCFTKAGARVA